MKARWSGCVTSKPSVRLMPMRAFAVADGLMVMVARTPAVAACSAVVLVALASTARGLPTPLVPIDAAAANVHRLIHACSSIAAADGRSDGCFLKACMEPRAA